MQLTSFREVQGCTKLFLIVSVHLLVLKQEADDEGLGGEKTTINNQVQEVTNTGDSDWKLASVTA